ncbi:alpha/beta hydrolase family esterase [Nocardia sp. NPDC056100]|uniref:extracellular catalytic domain type 1 short-chain-length polyhydroxyalkanoate depolymerase n=1 Tax=Nocardia sp. NPDC056100 TaxID=3345712 RepID=UPI0035DF3DCC
MLTRTVRGVLAGMVLSLVVAVPSIADVTAAAQTTDLSWHEYGSGAAARRYLLYRPPQLAAGSPVVMWLHGCWFRGTDPSDADRERDAMATGFPALAAAQGFAVVFPQQPRSANSDECWNWFDPVQQWCERGEVATLAGMVSEAVDELRADPKRVYLAGHSAGGAMTAVLGAVHPERFAALGISAGFPAVTGLDSLGTIAGSRMIERGVRSLPVTVVTGSADPVSPPWVQGLVAGEWRSAGLAASAGRVDILAAVAAAIVPPTPDSVDTYPAGDGEYARTVSHYDIDGRIGVDHWVFGKMGHEYPAATMTPALWRFFTASGASR